MSQQDNNRNLGGLFNRMALSWRLLTDRRVNIAHKLIPILAGFYLLSPIDFVPELLLGPLAPLGIVDDIGLVIFALEFFIRMAPSNVVREHLEDLQRRYTGEKRKQSQDENVVEGQYRYRE